MTEDEARRCAAIFRERWSEEQLQLILEKPCVENGMEYVLRLVLPQQPSNQRQLRMRYPQQTAAALAKLTEVLGKGGAVAVAQQPKKPRKTYQWKSGTRPPRPARAATPRQVVAEPVSPGPPIRWEYGDMCQIVGRRDGPFTVLAQPAQNTLLCQRVNGTLFHCQADLARLIAKG